MRSKMFLAVIGAGIVLAGGGLLAHHARSSSTGSAPRTDR
jgi:hypothetical protein